MLSSFGFLLFFFSRLHGTDSGLFGDIGDVHVTDEQMLIPSLMLKTHESFAISINEVAFNNSRFVDEDDGQVHFRPSLLNMPDLPKWMKFVYSDYYRNGFIYGVPEKSGNMTVEIIATNKVTYKTMRRLVRFSIAEKPMHARCEAEIRFSLMNVDDMLVDDRLERLLEIFERRLWKGGRDLHVTLVESVVAMGGRRPPNPREKEGVIVRIGSGDYFSRELLSLDREVMKLHERGPCRKEKKTSAERFFRDEELIPDWCGFKLLNETSVRHHHGSDGGHEPIYSPIHLGSSDFNPPSMMLVSRSLLVDFLICVILPAVMAFASVVALSFIMFGRREGVEKRNRDTPSVQMVQYASIHRASNNLRSLTAKRDGNTPVPTTPSSTLNRSYAGSPNNTLAKGNDIKKPDESKLATTKADHPLYGFPNHQFESSHKITA